jgi:hypothetical protein
MNTFINVSTSSAYVALPDMGCNVVRVHNPNAVTVDVQLNGGGGVVTIPASAARTFYSLTNAKAVAVRRTDLSATPVTVQAEVIG